jgi:(S)-ureidoglycine aminohydrolase
LNSLGHTRSAFAHDHLLQTPDTFIRTILPGMSHASAIVHTSPALGARCCAYTAELDRDGTLGQAIGQRFLYVLEGTVLAGGETMLAGGYVYGEVPLTAREPSRLFVIEKTRVPREGVNPPANFAGNEKAVQGQPLGEDPDLEVRALIPDRPEFDFAVNTMTYRPGASLSVVEIHVMEHCLLMLKGGGIYRLGDCWYPVQAGDFIWMRSFCPQWFGAIGKTQAKYIIYKDWNRHPLSL